MITRPVLDNDPDVILDRLRREARSCTACDLYRTGTQTVFGEGPGDAEVVMVGEQPGDQEDLAGRPFVGPAGQLLDRALVQAGVDRSKVYVTNAVKHFKFEPRGKRRIHSKPNTLEIAACNPWLVQEIAALRPSLVVALGATGARAVLGREIKIMSQRGTVFDLDYGGKALVTVHPSFLLRLPDEDAKAAEFERFLRDLRTIPELVPTAAAA